MLYVVFLVWGGGGGWLGRGAVLLWGLASERWSRESASEHLARARPQKRPGVMGTITLRETGEERLRCGVG